jgi:hypothetical protein
MHHEHSYIATMHTTGGIKAIQKGKPSKLKMSSDEDGVDQEKGNSTMRRDAIGRKADLDPSRLVPIELLSGAFTCLFLLPIHVVQSSTLDLGALW